MFQHRCSTNVWYDTIGNTLVGPYLFAGNLNKENYQEILKHNYKDFLDYKKRHKIFPSELCISVRRSLHWLSIFPDFNPLDYFLCNYIRDIIYTIIIYKT